MVYPIVDLLTIVSILNVAYSVIKLLCFGFKLVFEICDFSFEKSPRHDAYVPKFEAELAQFCEKLVSSIALSFRTSIPYSCLS